ncbi:MAG: bifunctional folylpolyglutamate synthase/dihydrofolate synthase [Alphaproteobacteria bacterium]|nr:bifunctional folylpolyglutamate synthase/dihydrofolate synthase [Alphaproteobacteria bacterium]
MNLLPKHPKFVDGDQRARVFAVADAAGIDLALFSDRSCVITGSNGKGSTAAMLQAILMQEKAPVGLFTSPHLLRIHERFRIDDDDIDDAALKRHWRAVEDAADASAAHVGVTNGFEFLFLVAASWFQERGCAAVVWEAGIGGRHDVTRLAAPKLAAVTSLDLEHTHLLGDTLEAIALDKMDVAAEGAVIVFGETCEPHRAAIEARARDRHCTPVFVTPEACSVSPPLPGAHQRMNAAIAQTLAGHLLGSPAAARAATIARLAHTRWPGRLETISAAPRMIIDVGHTPAAIEAALEGFAALAGEAPRILAVGCSVDKDATAIVSRLAPAFPRIIATAARHKGRAAAEIAALARDYNPGATVVGADTVEAARALALDWAQDHEATIYAAGGLFLAAEFKAAQLGMDPDALAFF